MKRKPIRRTGLAISSQSLRFARLKTKKALRAELNYHGPGKVCLSFRSYSFLMPLFANSLRLFSLEVGSDFVSMKLS